VRKTRPSAWWFMVPVALFLGAVVVFALVIVPTFGPAIRSVLRTDASVPLDGQQHSVVLDGTGDRYLWFPDGVAPDAGCLVMDAASRQPIPLRRPFGTTTRDLNGVPEHAEFVFSPVSAELVVTCGRPGFYSSQVPYVEIGPAIGIHGFARIGVSILAMIALAGLGAVSLLALIILFATRQPRAPQAPA
jgi:hypothetical protein